MRTNAELIQSFYISFSDFDISNINNRYEIITFSLKGSEFFRIYCLNTIYGKKDLDTWYIDIPIIEECIRIPINDFGTFLEIFRKKIDILINIKKELEKLKMDINLLKDKESLKSLIRDSKINKLL